VKKTLLILAYVALVLGVDALAYLDIAWPFEWKVFQWVWGDVEIFKLVFWLFLPLAFCWKNLDREWYSFARWRPADVILLIAVTGLGGLLLLTIPLFPGLRETYLGVSDLSPSVRREFVIGISTWTLTWLPAWEFLLRYVLLRTAAAQWPRFGWWLVPLADGLYHLQKAWPEVAMAVLFSIVLTYWAFRRRNGLLPLIAHAIVEIQLIALMVLMW
jgi:hypothetical protein